MRNVSKKFDLASWVQVTVVICLTLATPQASHAIDIDWNAGVGDWFEPLNWNPQQVPAGFGGGSAGDDASINNGGTAQANTSTAPVSALAEARTISVGAGGSAGGLSGTLESTGVTVETVFGFSAGVAEVDATGASGSVAIEGADLDSSGTSVRAGVVSLTSGAASADGEILVTNGGLTSAFLNIGVVQFNSFGDTPSPTATATGWVEVDNDVIGAAQVGANIGGASGTSAIGTLLIHDGDYDPRGGGNGITVGRNSAPNNASFGAGSAEGHFEQLNGRIVLANSLNGTFAPSAWVGAAFGGLAEGSVSTTGLDMAGHAFDDMFVGQASGSGNALGSFVSGGGDAVLEGELGVGVTFANGGGSSDGFANFGVDAVIHGQDSSATTFAVGNTRSYGLFNNDGLGTAEGELHASGVVGFNSYRIGVAEGTIQQASVQANGLLFLGADGIAGQTDGESTFYIGASLGSPNNGQIIGPGGTAYGEANIDNGDISAMRYIAVGVSESVSNQSAAGFGPASGSLFMNGGDVTTRNLAVGRAFFNQTSQSDAPDARPAAEGHFEMTGGALTVEAPTVGSILTTAQIRVGVANSFEAAPEGDPDYPTDISASAEVHLTGVVTTGNSNLQIGIATGYDLGMSTADGEVIVEGGSMQVGSLAIGVANGDEELARGSLQLTDSSLTVTESAAIGSGSDAMGELISTRSDVSVGEQLLVGRFRTLFAPEPMRGTVVITEATLNVGTDLLVGPQYQGGVGELRLIDVDAEVGDYLALGASSNSGSLFGVGVIDLVRSTLNAQGDGFLDSGELRLLDSQMEVGGNLRTEFFTTSTFPPGPGYRPGTSADVEIHLRRSLLVVGQEFAHGVDDLLQITIDGVSRGDEFGAVDAATVELLGGDLQVEFDFIPSPGVHDFDLIVSADVDGISGDFGSVSVLGLDPLSTYTAGVVIDNLGDGSVEIYRLTVVTVPEPSTLFLSLIVLTLTGWRRIR